MKILQFRIIILVSVVLPAAILSTYANADTTTRSASLYAYTGYLSVPSAYIHDAQLGIHYSFFPDKVSAVHTGESDNQVYSATLGFLPFMECYFSVFVIPSFKLMYKYGSLKTRSPGVKLRVLKEKKWIPATSIGVFDPDIHKLHIVDETGEGRSNVSSTFIVFSKQLGFNAGSVSLGYGFDSMSGVYHRLKGMFGGVTICLNEFISVSADYDARYWSGGIKTHWSGIDLAVAVIDGVWPVYRIGYSFNLPVR